MGIAKALVDAARGVFLGERTDGDRLEVKPYRRMLVAIMPGRMDSVVYMETYARADNLIKYLEEVNQRFHADVTHCLVAAVAVALAEHPKMNRFISGGNVYQRRERICTFSMKRQKMGMDAKVSAVKLQMREHETFRDLCERINAHIKVERSDTRTHTDKEFDLLSKLPPSVLDAAVKTLRFVDSYNALPQAFMETDAMYTSAFIANLGSLGMNAAYHYLYEWGNCPIFMGVGKIEKRPLIVNNRVKITPVIPIRFSFEDRISDGINAGAGINAAIRVLENPYEELGCLAEDGSDAVRLDPPPTRSR